MLAKCKIVAGVGTSARWVAPEKYQLLTQRMHALGAKFIEHNQFLRGFAHKVDALFEVFADIRTFKNHTLFKGLDVRVHA